MQILLLPPARSSFLSQLTKPVKHCLFMCSFIQAFAVGTEIYQVLPCKKRRGQAQKRGRQTDEAARGREGRPDLGKYPGRRAVAGAT